MEKVNERKTVKKQRQAWPKYLDLFLRVCHIGSSTVLFGGVVWAVPFVRLTIWHNLSIVTGGALIISGISGSRHWPYQGRGLMAAVHIGLVWLVHLWPGSALKMLAAALVFGVIGSHLPGNIRHWSLLHRRRMD